MRIALAEAALALREGAHPYPGVGVVIVHQGRPIVRAHNGKPGASHAEVLAIREALTKEIPLAETVLYTNLEPCCNRVGLVHACTLEIINNKIPEVHISIRDPYQQVRGQGLKELREAGVKLVVGELEDECRWLLRDYIARFCPCCGWPVKET
jgi:diaminohydroxyphosphoribosylaminopyrimidine deaminase/5-amino-6-(5-phosphoribosylamino)uracil reductase